MYSTYADYMRQKTGRYGKWTISHSSKKYVNCCVQCSIFNRLSHNFSLTVIFLFQSLWIIPNKINKVNKMHSNSLNSNFKKRMNCGFIRLSADKGLSVSYCILCKEISLQYPDHFNFNRIPINPIFLYNSKSIGLRLLKYIHTQSPPFRPKTGL